MTEPRYSLHSAAQAAQALRPQVPDSCALQGFPPRFVDTAVEHHFRLADHEAARSTRALCFMLGAVLAALASFAWPHVLADSPELITTALAGSLMFQLPTLMLGCWLATQRSLRLGLASDLQLALVLIIEVHAQLFRLLCERHGTAFPSSVGFFGLCVAVTSFGLPLRRAGTVLVLFLIGAKASEFASMRLSPADYRSMAFDTLLVAVSLIAAYRADVARREAYSLRGVSERQASVDTLTGLSNRCGFAADADRIVRHAAREQHPVTLALIDIDHFKAVNDSAGHGYGDFVLARIAQVLQQQLRRPLDTCARLGDDEFVMLWHAPREAYSRDVGRVVVEAVRALQLRQPESGQAITISVGVVTLTPVLASDLDRMMRLADRALYEARQQGRDRSHTVRPGPLHQASQAAY